jgi:hypothetical protein
MFIDTASRKQSPAPKGADRFDTNPVSINIRSLRDGRALEGRDSIGLTQSIEMGEDYEQGCDNRTHADGDTDS